MAAENQVLAVALGIYIGLTLIHLFTAIARDIVLPLLSPLAGVQDGIAKLEINIGSVKLNIGDLLVNIINVIVVFTIVSFTVPYIREYVPVAGRR